MPDQLQPNIAGEVFGELSNVGAHTGQAVKFDGYDSAIVGYAYVFRENSFRYCIVYSYEQLLDCYLQLPNVECGDDPLQEAEDYINFNLIGMYVGPHTPIVAREWFSK